MLIKLLIRLLGNALALAIIVSLLPQGIRIVAETQEQRLTTLILVALIFGLVNTFVKPLVKLLTCPVIFLTLGLALLLVNGAMFWLTAALSGGRLVVENFGWAIVGAILMSIFGMILDRIMRVIGLGDDQD